MTATSAAVSRREKPLFFLNVGVGLLVGFSAIATLVGWAVDPTSMLSERLRYEAMRPVTAVLVVALGLVLALAFPPAGWRGGRGFARAGRILSAGVLAVAVFSLAHTVLGLSFSIDQWFFQQVTKGAVAGVSGSMSADTASGFLLLAGACWIILGRKSDSPAWLTAATLTVFLVTCGAAYFAALAHLSGGYSEHGPWSTSEPLSRLTAKLLLPISLMLLINAWPRVARWLAIRRWVLICFMTGIGLLFFMTITAGRAQIRTSALLNRVAQTLTVKNELSEVFSEFVRVQASLRGHTVTGDEGYGANYSEAHALLKTRLTVLRRLIEGNPEQIGRFERLDAAIRDGESWWAHPARATAGASLAGGINEQVIRGIQLGRVVRRLTREMHDAEDRQLVQERQDARNAEQRVQGIILSGGGLALVFIVFGLVGMNRAKRQAEKSEAHFRALFDQTGVGVATGEVGSWRLLEVNRRYCDILGYPREELLVMDFKEFTHPDDVRENLHQLDRLREGAIDRFSLAKRYVRKDGTLVWANIDVSRLRLGAEAEERFIVTVQDITRQKRAEEKLARRMQVETLVADVARSIIQTEQEQFEAGINRALGLLGAFSQADRAYVFLFSRNGSVMDNTHEWCAPGINPQLDNLRDLPVEAYPWWVEQIRNFKPINIPRVSALPAEAGREKKALLAQGIQSLTVVPLAGQGKAIGFIGFDSVGAEKQWPEEEVLLLRNVAEILSMVLMSRQDEEQLRIQGAALEAAGNGIVITDPTGAIEWVNPAFEKLTGYTREEAVGRNVRFLKSGEHDAAFYRELWQTIQSGKIWHNEMINRRKDGTFYTEEQTIAPVRDARGKIVRYVAIKQDVTVQKYLDAQLQRNQRLESVGRLARGVAHDINNILTPMLMIPPLIRPALPDEGSRKLLDGIETSANRGAAIVRQLLASGGGDGPRVSLRPALLVGEVAVLVAGTFSKNIRVEREGDKEAGSVMADADQLRQVLMNLCMNARDAMPDGGVLTLKAANRVLDEVFVQMHPDAHAGQYVALAVGDTGTGISPEHLDKIFDPFFTTKETGKGIGLGLSTVQGIVKKHGGFIDVRSRPGKGSLFTVYLPATEEVPAEPAEEPASGEVANGNGELILLVDDEKVLREATRAVLERYNYRVLEAANGALALQQYEPNRSEISLILVDITMPVMDGPTFIGKVKKMDAAVRIIVMSGHQTHMGDEQRLAGTVDAFLHKPFQVQLLVQTIAAVLHPAVKSAV